MNTHPSFIKVHAVHGHDSMDGGWSDHVLSYHLLAHDAKAAAKGKGWYGGDAYVSEQFAVKVGDQFYLLKSTTPIDLDGEQKRRTEELRKEALALLSPEHRIALGLPPG
jgi:hypothetical protein